MGSFAIVRADGSIDKAEGASVQDVADRYGWPGDGSIRPWEAGDEAAHSFASPDDQLAEYLRQHHPDGSVRKAALSDAATEKAVAEVTVSTEGNS